MNSPNRKSKVYLVGAGPGDPDLITIRAAHLLSIADVVICDKLASEYLLKYTRPDAEIIPVPKRTEGKSFTQQQIDELLIQKAQQGKTIVRLKGGDPCIFGRGGEEARLLAQNNIDFEIVPGITAATAAAEYAGIMLTDRTYSSQLVFVTGREAPDKEQSGIDWPLLAKLRATLVFYMGVGNLPRIVNNLLTHGMDPATPACIIQDATTPFQKTVKAPIAEICKKSKQQKVTPPALIIIGPAADADPRLDWFTRKPLFAKTIAVTRDKKGNADLAEKIIAQGGNPLDIPTIALEPLTTHNDFLEGSRSFPEYDWIILTSANGVRILFDFLQELGKDARVFARAKIAAIGPATAAALAENGIRPDFIPTVFTSEQLAKQLAKSHNLKNRRALLLRSAQADNEMSQILTRFGTQCKQLPLYTVKPHLFDPAPVIELIKTDHLDWLTFASPSAVHSFFEQIDINMVKSYKIKTASIGPVTTRALQDFGLIPIAEAREHTFDGLLEAIKDY